jgi:hypothetical protein
VGLTFTNVSNAMVTASSLVSTTTDQNAGAQSVETLSGDRFRIAVEGGRVKYYKYVNNQLQEIPARNTAVANFPLHLDAALYGEQASISDVRGTRQN